MSTKQEVSIVEGAALEEAGSQSQAGGDLTVQIELKSERVQEGLAAGGGETAPPAFTLDLAVQPARPVTLEIFDPKVTVTVHGAEAGPQPLKCAA